MTDFLRSAAGISNLHLFLRSDIVIYTEGGDVSYGEEEIVAGKYNKYSVDIKFWSTVLEAVGFDRKVSFRALGSKISVKNISDKIVAGQISNVAVALDSDLDGFFGTKFDSPLILYTRGYSWENDVYSVSITLRQIESMLMLDHFPQGAKNLVDGAYKEFEGIGRRVAWLEYAFRAAGVRFVSDLKGERFFSAKNDKIVNRPQIRAVFVEKKSTLKGENRPAVKRVAVCPYNDNFGKLIAAMSVSVICRVCKEFGGWKSVSVDMLKAAMIEKFGAELNASQSSPAIYYKQLGARLESACG